MSTTSPSPAASFDSRRGRRSGPDRKHRPDSKERKRATRGPGNIEVLFSWCPRGEKCLQIRGLHRPSQASHFPCRLFVRRPARCLSLAREREPVGCQNSVTGCKSVIFRDVDRVLHPTRPRRARAATDLDARRTALRPSVSLTHSPSARRKTSRWPSLNKTKRTISTEEAGASRTAATAMDAARSTGYR